MRLAASRLGLRGCSRARPITTDLVLLGAGHAHVEVLRRFAMRPGARGAPHSDRPRAGDTLHRHAAGADPRRLHVRPGTYRSGPARRQRRRAVDPGGGDGDRPGRAPCRGERAARRAVRPAVDRRRWRAGDAARAAACRSSRSARSSTAWRRWRPGWTAARALPSSAAAPAARNSRWPWRGATASGCGSCWCATAPEPLASAPSYARSVARAALVDAGVELACGVRAGNWAGGRLTLSDGSSLDVASALWATGVVGPAFLAASGLACDAAGCVLVDATLRSVSHPRSLPPATAPPSRAARGRSPASGRCAPARRWRPICAGQHAVGRRAAGGRRRRRWRS